MSGKKKKKNRSNLKKEVNEKEGNIETIETPKLDEKSEPDRKNDSKTEEENSKEKELKSHKNEKNKESQDD